MDRYYIYGVNFKDNGKIYHFKSKIRCPINVTVITETEKGLQFGKVVSFIGNENADKVDDLKDIIRISTKKDYEEYLKNLRDADQALKQCRILVKELNLDMKMINASFTFDRKQLIFNFLADERIDFSNCRRCSGEQHHPEPVPGPLPVPWRFQEGRHRSGYGRSRYLCYRAGVHGNQPDLYLCAGPHGADLSADHRVHPGHRGSGTAG